MGGAFGLTSTTLQIFRWLKLVFGTIFTTQIGIYLDNLNVPDSLADEVEISRQSSGLNASGFTDQGVVAFNSCLTTIFQIFIPISVIAGILSLFVKVQNLSKNGKVTCVGNWLSREGSPSVMRNSRYLRSQQRYWTSCFGIFSRRSHTYFTDHIHCSTRANGQQSILEPDPLWCIKI